MDRLVTEAGRLLIARRAAQAAQAAEGPHGPFPQVDRGAPPPSALGQVMAAPAA
jgi:hypothetical protein